ncbi:MAG: ribosome maturation factor RimP [Streptosporangiaceae bacterium]
MSVSPRRDRLVRLLEPALTEAGFDLEDVTLRPAGRRRVLRVVVDHDSGVGLDDTASLSRTLSGILDASDVMGQVPYVLEVTSPGVGRPLTRPRHWRRAVGRLVRVTLLEGGYVTGRVAEADDAKVLLEVDGARQPLSYDELGQGKVQVEFHDRGKSGG